MDACGNLGDYETMTTTIPSCDKSKRTLAAGDQEGLTAIYGYH